MTLQEFVRESLLQIATGVNQAHGHNANVGMGIGALGNQNASVTLIDGRAGVMIDYDVAVMVTEKSEKEGGAAISVVSVFGLGGKATNASETSSYSRIRFSVPIVYSAD